MEGRRNASRHAMPEIRNEHQNIGSDRRNMAKKSQLNKAALRYVWIFHWGAESSLELETLSLMG